MSSIQFTTVNTVFNYKNRTQTKNWIKEVIKSENKVSGNISIIFTCDDYLQQINIKYLNHNTLTDVITFNYNEGNVINGDIFISVERVKENAVFYNQLFYNELHRVIVHGILHLLSYKDKSNIERWKMEKLEDKYLEYFYN
ncbi:MAG: rRNA maturation RNase YbeY [Bacteroidota bacterium]